MSTEQKLKSIIYTNVRKICREVGEQISMEYDTNSLDLIGELTWKKLHLMIIDLEAFQKHAKRSSVTADDVKLLTRRNESLMTLLDEKLQFMNQNKAACEPSTSAGNKRKRKTSSASSSNN